MLFTGMIRQQINFKFTAQLGLVIATIQNFFACQDIHTFVNLAELITKAGHMD
jgi:hypothetical protein